jgi:nitroreductase
MKEMITMNKKSNNRRDFLKQGAMLGGGMLLTRTNPQDAMAEETPKHPAQEQAQPANETLKTISKLRTIHGNFLDKPLPESALQTILQASVRAANTSNLQNYSIVVVKDREKMKQVCTYQGSCLLVYCVDYNRMKTLAEHLEHSFFPDNMNCFCLASIDAVLAIQTAAITARSLGIDYLITNGIHRGDMNRLWKLLDLPTKHCFPLIAMVLGYPTEEPASKKGRLNGPGIIHYEKYHRMTKDEAERMVRQYDDPEHHLALVEDWKAGQSHYLDWVFTKWWPAPKPTEQETQILRFIKRSGFMEAQKS